MILIDVHLTCFNTIGVNIDGVYVVSRSFYEFSFFVNVVGVDVVGVNLVSYVSLVSWVIGAYMKPQRD
jgi:hypothetical protein